GRHLLVALVERRLVEALPFHKGSKSRGTHGSLCRAHGWHPPHAGYGPADRRSTREWCRRSHIRDRRDGRRSQSPFLLQRGKLVGAGIRPHLRREPAENHAAAV